MAKETYTIDDLARELGVSKTTVSRAISGKGRVGEETRRRVLELMEMRGYRPNAVAKGLAQNRTYNVGVAIPQDETGREFAFFRECLFGICDAACRRDYDVLVTVDSDPKQIQRILENRKVDGMIVARSQSSPTVSMIADSGLPFVVLGRSGEAAVSVDNNNELGSRALTERLIDSGYTRLALLGGDSGLAVTASRARGFYDACVERGVSDTVYFPDITSEADAQAAVTGAMAQGAQVLVCMDDTICGTVMLILALRKLRVPRDIRVACFYDSELLARISPPVTAVRYDARLLGGEACLRLLELIEGGSPGSVILPDFQLMLRESTGG